MVGLCVALQSCSGMFDTTAYGREREQSLYNTVSGSDIKLMNDLSHTKGSHFSFQTQSILKKTPIHIISYYIHSFIVTFYDQRKQGHS